MAPEAELLESALTGNQGALNSLIEPLRTPLFAYIYRMVTHREDAEDLMQDVLIRVLERLPSFRGEARFKTWLFGIATHVCLDHLRSRKRWRIDAQLRAEQAAEADPVYLEGMLQQMSEPGFSFEIREHIAFCFSCVSRTLEPEAQAAIMLREVFEFSNQEAARMIGISEPVFRHRLSAARSFMTSSYDGLCALINKEGVCYQCKGLRDVAPPQHCGDDLVQIEVAPGIAITSESLFDARLGIVRTADLENGRTSALHTGFFQGITVQEQ
jgi:RNA polymerase sigma-70 factor (ECF subfamily)